MSRVAVSVMPVDGGDLRAQLAALPDGVGFVEVRLDGMAEVPDAAALFAFVAASPVPLILTFRPVREGGRYAGAEEARLEVLRASREAGAAWIDVEWDALAAFGRGGGGGGGGGVLASRHWFDRCPADLASHHADLSAGADAVKLAVAAHTPADVVAVLDTLGRASKPTVAIAMGQLGWITRVVAPCFPRSLLTYAAAAPGAATAPGQPAVQELVGVYRLHLAGPDTAVVLHVGELPPRAELAAANAEQPGAVLHVPLPKALAPVVAPVLAEHLVDVRTEDGW